jgi:hypothetical protein
MNRTLACYGDAVVLPVPHPDVGSSQLGCEALAKVIEETARDVLHVCTKGVFADEKEGMKAGKGHTVSYIGEMMPLSRGGKRIQYDRRVLPRINGHGSGARLRSSPGCVVLEYISQTRYCMAQS